MMNFKARLFTWYETVSTSYWFVPSLMSAAAVFLSIFMLWLDRIVTEEWFNQITWLYYTGSADGARTLLGVIASSMIGLAGVVFSITIVALTLASGQFGPRLLRNFMRDKGNQITLGTFLSAFLYCLMILREVHGGSDSGKDVFVPQMSILIAVLMALAGLGVLIYFIHHAAESIQAPNIIAAVSYDLQKLIDELYPEMIGQDPSETASRGSDATACEQVPENFEVDAVAVEAGIGGYIQWVEADLLMQEATKTDLLLRVEYRLGQYVQWDDVIVRVRPRSHVNDEVLERIRQSFTINDQRSLSQDAEFAIEQLVEIAVRALSPGINDPFTAMQCIDRLGEALSRLATRKMPSPYRLDDQGRLRVISYGSSFETFLDLALSQIYQYASESLDVLLRMLLAIERIAKHVGSVENRVVLHEHAKMIHEAASKAASADREQRNVRLQYEKVLGAMTCDTDQV